MELYNKVVLQRHVGALGVVYGTLSMPDTLNGGTTNDAN